METDNHLILRHSHWIRLLVTSMNVIHSWGIYSLGWKFDGIPGILNGIYYHLCFIGFFNGLCYELCGLLHNFMSIRLRSIIYFYFDLYVDSIFNSSGTKYYFTHSISLATLTPYYSVWDRVTKWRKYELL